MTEKGLNLIKKFEGCKLKAYLCPAKKWTIGWGATYYKDGSKVKEGDIITQDEADELLMWMMENEYESFVKKTVTSEINPYQSDALSSFAYNCGTGNLKRSTLLKKVNANPNDPAIANEFAKWNKSNGVVLTGLTRRRKAETTLYFTEWVAPEPEPTPEPEPKPKKPKTLTGYLQSEGIKPDNIRK